MPLWLQWLLAIAVILAAAPFIAMLGRRYGKTVKRTSGLALLMLGFGQILDPPSRHIIEAADREEEDEAAGDPPEPDAPPTPPSG